MSDPHDAAWRRKIPMEFSLGELLLLQVVIDLARQRSRSPKMRDVLAQLHERVSTASVHFRSS